MGSTDKLRAVSRSLIEIKNQLEEHTDTAQELGEAGLAATLEEITDSIEETLEYIQPLTGRAA